MKKSILILFITIFSLQLSFSQSSKVNTASILMSDYKLDKNPKDLIRAKEVIEEATKNESTSMQGKTWYYRGLVYSLLAQDKTTKADGTDYTSVAIESFQKALSLNDKKFRDKNKAIESLKQLSVSSFNSGVESFKSGDFKTAYSKFQRTIDLNNTVKSNGQTEAVKSVVAYEYSAIAASNAGMNEEAISSYKLLMDADKEGNYYSSLAKLYKKMGNNEMYEKTLEEGAKAFPDDAGIIIEQLNILIKANKLDEAMDKIDKAIELDPKNSNLYAIKAQSLNNAGNEVEAIQNYEKAIEVDPKNTNAIYMLGTIYFLQSNKYIEEMNSLSLDQQAKYDELKEKKNQSYLKAKPYFENVLEIDPNDALAKKALKKIQAQLD